MQAETATKKHEPKDKDSSTSLKAASKKEEQAELKLTDIEFRSGYNSRTEIVKDEDMVHLAESIKAHGLISPISVVPYINKHGDETGRYWIACGSRRFFALTEVLKLRGQVRAVIRRDLIDNPTRAAEVNLAENAQRNDLKTADLARRCWEMVHAKYPGAEEDAKPVTREKVALAIGKTKGYVANLVRSWEVLSRGSREAWHKEELPTDFVVSILAKEPEAANQRKILERWRNQPEQGHGKSRAELMPKKEHASSSKVEAAAESRPSVTKAKAGDEVDVDSPPTKREVMAKIADLRESIDSLESKREREIATAWLDALRWAVGDIKVLRARAA